MSSDLPVYAERDLPPLPSIDPLPPTHEPEPGPEPDLEDVDEEEPEPVEPILQPVIQRRLIRSFIGQTNLAPRRTWSSATSH